MSSRVGRPTIAPKSLYPEKNGQDMYPLYIFALFAREKRNNPERIVNISSIVRCFKSMTLVFANLKLVDFLVEICYKERGESLEIWKNIPPLLDSTANVFRFNFKPPTPYKRVQHTLKILVNGSEIEQLNIRFFCPTSKARFFNNKEWYQKKCIAALGVSKSLTQTKPPSQATSETHPLLEKYSLVLSSSEEHVHMQNLLENRMSASTLSPIYLPVYHYLLGISRDIGDGLSTFNGRQDVVSHCAQNRERNSQQADGCQ